MDFRWDGAWRVLCCVMHGGESLHCRRIHDLMIPMRKLQIQDTKKERKKIKETTLQQSQHKLGWLTSKQTNFSKWSGWGNNHKRLERITGFWDDAKIGEKANSIEVLLYSVWVLWYFLCYLQKWKAQLMSAVCLVLAIY